MAFNIYMARINSCFGSQRQYTVDNKHVYRGNSHAKDEKMITKTNRN